MPKTITRTLVVQSRSAGPSSRAGGVRLVLLVALILAGLVSVGAMVMMSDAGANASATTLELYKVSETTFDISITASGELEAKKQTEIRNELETQATIIEVISEGSQVQEGELLVKFSSDVIESQIDEEMLRVETSRNELVSAKNSLDIQESENEANRRKAELKLELARIEYRKWIEGDVVKTRQEHELAIDRANRTLELRKEQFEKTKNLFDRDFASKNDLQSDELAFIEAQANIKQTELDKWIFETYEFNKQEKKLTSDVNEAEAELSRVKSENANRLASKQADLTNKQRQLVIREEKLGKLTEQLTATTITAPTAGLVVYASSMSSGRGRVFFGGSGPIQVGRSVSPNELIIVLPAVENMVASVRVHESVAGRIRPGQPVSVKIDAKQNQVYDGVVSSIGVLAESESWRDPNLREYTVKIDLTAANDTGELKPSMRCEAEVTLGKVEGGLAVPVQAVHRDGAVSFVYTPAGSRFERTPVRLGRRSSVYAEIAAGLEEGVSVLVREPKPGEVLSGEFDEETIASLMPKPGERGFGNRQFAGKRGGAPAGAVHATNGAGDAKMTLATDGDADTSVAKVITLDKDSLDKDGSFTFTNSDGETQTMKIDTAALKKMKLNAANLTKESSTDEKVAPETPSAETPTADAPASDTS